MDHFDESIAALQKTLAEHEDKVRETKNLINALARAAGRAPIYDVVDDASDALASIGSDTFYGQPLAKCVRQILSMRKASGAGAAPIREIYESLTKGGFEFPRAKSDKNAMDSLRISLGKMSHTFHKVPNGSYGLLEWYPAVKSKKASNPKGKDDEHLSDDEAASDETEASTGAE